MPFQNIVNILPAPGLAGDYASANARINVPTGQGALVAGAGGVVMGRFAWIDATGSFVVNRGSGPPAGFVHRSFGEAMIVTYLAETGNVVPQGFEVTVHNFGDFWASNAGTNQVTIGMKAYTSFADGSVTFNTTGTPPPGAVITGSIAPAAATVVTGAIAANVLTVTAVGSGVLVVGASLTGTNLTAGTTITSQTGGTAGGIGTYLVSVAQTVASTAITAAYGVLTVTASSSGVLVVGDPISGTGITAGTYVVSAGTGQGGLGTYNVNLSQTAGSTAIAAVAAIETKFTAMTTAGPGEVVIMSSWPMG